MNQRKQWILEVSPVTRQDKTMTTQQAQAEWGAAERQLAAEWERQLATAKAKQIASRVRVPSSGSGFICLPSGINLNTAFIVEIIAHENTQDEAIVCRWTGREADSPTVEHYDGDDARAIHAFLGRTKEQVNGQH